MALTADQLALLMGQQLPPAEFATDDRLQAVLNTVAAVAKAYTRGNGWDAEGNPAEDIEAAIYSASMRWLVNPSQIPQRVEMGTFVTDLRSGFVGWSLVELGVLNDYRERAL
jgi:hypothetical protein